VLTLPGDTLRRWGAARRSWRALGTYVQLAVDDHDAADEAEQVVRRVLDHVDRSCSRFREDSDLVRANACAGRTVDVDPLLVAAVDTALEAARTTDGLVDPTLGLAMVAAGYDRDFALLCGDEPEPAGGAVAVPTAPRRSGWREVETHRDGRLMVPSGVALDLGATGKAFASDLAASLAGAAVGSSVLLSLGGDVAVGTPGGTAQPIAGWPVGVQETEPAADGSQEVVLVDRGGLATSSTLARSWTLAGSARHHVLDPRTGRPADVVWRTVSATGATCVDANTATTAAIVLGDRAERWLMSRQIPARLVARDGRVVRVGGWPDPLVLKVGS
jgi:thiamine biosynthesis lipoprotein